MIERPSWTHRVWANLPKWLKEQHSFWCNWPATAAVAVAEKRRETRCRPSFGCGFGFFGAQLGGVVCSRRFSHLGTIPNLLRFCFCFLHFHFPITRANHIIVYRWERTNPKMTHRTTCEDFSGTLTRQRGMSVAVVFIQQKKKKETTMWHFRCLQLWTTCE